MFKSLMFKTNPLVEEFEKYRQRKMGQGKVQGNKNKKINDKSKPRSQSEQRSYNHSIRLTSKYPQPILKQSLQRNSNNKPNRSPQEEKKCTLKVPNKSIRNDNFLIRSISPQSPQKLKLSKRYSYNQKSQLPQTVELNKNYSHRLENESMYNSITSNSERKRPRRNVGFRNISNIGMECSFFEDKNQQQIKTMTTQNELKSTIYQSIDLGNIFQKIQSKIDLAKTIDDKDPQSDSSDKKRYQNELTRSNSKQSKIIEKLRSQLKSSNANTSQIVKQFNIKTLIQKKFQNQISQQSHKMPRTPQPESLTSRDPYFPQPSDIDTLINSLSFNDSPQKSWMPSTRKKSSVFVIDEKGNIVEEDQKTRKNKDPKVKMSARIAKLRQVKKVQQISERKFNG